MMTKLLWRATAVLIVIGALAAVPLLLSHDSHSQSAAAKAVTARLAHAAVLERERGEEAGGGADAQAYTDRAYPGDEVSMDEIQGALAANNAATARGAKLGSKWDFIGPDTLDVDRLGTQSFIKPTQWSGRVTALAVDPKCKPQECTLYVGAAGGGSGGRRTRWPRTLLEADLRRDPDERDRLDRRRPERRDRQDGLRRHR